jgi:hypothetical protein
VALTDHTARTRVRLDDPAVPVLLYGQLGQRCTRQRDDRACSRLTTQEEKVNEDLQQKFANRVLALIADAIILIAAGDYAQAQVILRKAANQLDEMPNE